MPSQFPIKISAWKHLWIFCNLFDVKLFFWGAGGCFFFFINNDIIYANPWTYTSLTNLTLSNLLLNMKKYEVFKSYNKSTHYYKKQMAVKVNENNC